MGVVENIGFTRYPRQYVASCSSGNGIGRKVKVCFNYDIENYVDGVIIRDDYESPYIAIIQLVDGRVVLGTECQFSFENGHDKIDEAIIKKHGMFKGK